jgi:hypothetical protein
MQESGVAKLRIELNARGNYDFELVPTRPQAGDAKVEVPTGPAGVIQ